MTVSPKKTVAFSMVKVVAIIGGIQMITAAFAFLASGYFYQDSSFDSIVVSSVMLTIAIVLGAPSALLIAQAVFFNQKDSSVEVGEKSAAPVRIITFSMVKVTRIIGWTQLTVALLAVFMSGFSIDYSSEESITASYVLLTVFFTVIGPAFLSLALAGFFNKKDKAKEETEA